MLCIKENVLNVEKNLKPRSIIRSIVVIPVNVMLLVGENITRIKCMTQKDHSIIEKDVTRTVESGERKDSPKDSAPDVVRTLSLIKPYVVNVMNI